jgi:hypothetical protein
MRTDSPEPVPQLPVEHPTIHPSLELERKTDFRVADGIPEGVGGGAVREMNVPTFPTAQPMDPVKETEFKS